MKAWIVRENDKFCCTVVFAENREKAKTEALKTECCEYADYTKISARRFPEADSQYRGQSEMDWNDPNDRLFLVKEAGFYCEYIEPECCKKCSAKDYCDIYEDSFEKLRSEQK